MGELAHSTIGASSSKRWLACPASVPLSEHAPPQESSVFAEEGTAAHELGETCLLKGTDCEEYIGKTFNGFVVDEEMAEYVQEYVDLVRSHMTDGYELLVEERVDLSWIDERMFGTGDAVLVKPFHDGKIFDLKYGKGVRVVAEDNPQLAFYALGPFHDYDLESIEAFIVQPRIPEGITSAEWKMGDMNKWENLFRVGALATTQDNPKFEMGDHCRWCPALGLCPEQLTDFEDLPVEQNLDILSDDQVADVLQRADTITAFLKAVHAYAHKRAVEGHALRGYKLVAGRKGNRKWVDGIESTFPISEYPDLYTQKILTPTQTAKRMPELDMDELVTQAPAKPALVPSSDKRKELDSVAALDFDDLD